MTPRQQAAEPEPLAPGWEQRTAEKVPAILANGATPQQEAQTVLEHLPSRKKRSDAGKPRPAKALSPTATHEEIMAGMDTARKIGVMMREHKNPAIQEMIKAMIALFIPGVQP
jgi:hypothetical protein